MEEDVKNHGSVGGDGNGVSGAGYIWSGSER